MQQKKAGHEPLDRLGSDWLLAWRGLEFRLLGTLLCSPSAERIVFMETICRKRTVCFVPSLCFDGDSSRMGVIPFRLDDILHRHAKSDVWRRGVF